MSDKRLRIRNFEVEQLSTILSGSRFKFTNMDNATRIRVVRIQILLDPISESLDKARKTAESRFSTERLISLNEKKQQGELSDVEDMEFKLLFDEFRDNMENALSPLMNEYADVEPDKLSLGQYRQLLDANADWMTGSIPKLIFLHLVNENID